QVRQFSFAVVNSTTKGLPAWRDACAKHGKRVRVIPRDVRTRWNSVYDMLAVAIEYKAVFNDMTVNRDLDYRKFDISNADLRCWLEMYLTNLYQVFKDATLYFSSEKHCTITQVIPTMDKMDDIITATVSALKLAKKVMNKYYSATDESKVYRVAMGMSCVRYNTVSNTTCTVLHPNIKLEYFR
ncbi:hypothetical protein B0H10DRAFT_1712616, partial [Mycena sp. CBHHK59/15]